MLIETKKTKPTRGNDGFQHVRVRLVLGVDVDLVGGVPAGGEGETPTDGLDADELGIPVFPIELPMRLFAVSVRRQSTGALPVLPVSVLRFSRVADRHSLRDR